MRATIQNYLAAAKARREENGDKGFSLIELIVVVAILGILVAVAIPVFINIQGNAQTAANKAAAANGGTAVAAEIARNSSVTVAQLQTTILDQMEESGATLTVQTAAADGTLGTTVAPTLDNFCVTGTTGSGTAAKAGPGC